MAAVLAGPAGTGPRSLDFLIKYLAEGSNPAVRAGCAEDIGKLGPEAKPAARALCRALFDPSRRVRLAAAGALEKVAPDLYWPVNTLLGDRGAEEQVRAAAAIGRMKQDGSAGTPVLAYHLRLILQADRLLAVKGRQTQLSRQLRREQAMIREDDSLEEVLQKWLAQALGKLQDEVDGEELDSLAERRKALPAVVLADIHALRMVAPDDPTAVAAVASALRAGEPALKSAAVEALQAMGRSSAKLRGRVVGHLAAALKDPAAEVRLAAVRALAELAGPGDRPVPLLKRLAARDPSEDVRRSAAKVLARWQGR
jgi:HEAT repeat protein